MKKQILSCILLIILSISQALNAKVGKIKNGVELETPEVNVRVQFYGENIVRITKWSRGGSPEKSSLSVIMDSIPDLGITWTEDSNAVVVRSSQIVMKLFAKNGTIRYMSTDSTMILQETGTPLFTPVVYNSDSGFSVRQSFQLTPDEGIYGLGQHQDGYFNYRGKKVVLVQSNTNAVTSFLISTMNYGILWDNYSKTIFDDSAGAASLWSEMGDNIDYYFVHGKNMDDVISGYRTLTGKAPLYGKWAYGYWQSKEHYKTQAEVMSIAEKYRRLKMPIDNIIQDWDYWNGAANWSGMFFDSTLFPHPAEMCDELHRMHFHIIISIWPALGPKTAIYANMQRDGFLYKPVGWAGFKYYDAFNPAANELYWKYLRDGLYSKGLDGWWIDSSEPDVVNATTKESSEYELKKMGRNFLGSWSRYLNPFSLVMTDDIYKNWRKETSDRRAYILTRSTFTGQQRNAATTWSGDIGASWDVFRLQIPAGVNHSMSGIPYWTFDIGGFVLGAYGGVFMQGGKDPAYQELYTRMFQFGAFCPIFRSHGSETPREIWEMGEFTEPLIKIDNLRYRLMPYTYSLAWMVTDKDYTMMRGLPMDFQEDKKTYSIDDQYMFGPSIMVCPVTEYMYHRPPESSVLISPEYFKTPDGKPGLLAKYYRDPDRKYLSRDTVDPNIDFVWYTGRPGYLTDSMFAVTWQGKLIPKETGRHQFHLVSYDAKRIILNGDTLRMVYTSVEQYTELVELQAGKEYNLVLEMENRSTGAAKMRLFWKTPSIFAKEQMKETKQRSRKVYLPAGHTWYDFWTADTIKGGSTIATDAPIDKIPLFVNAGSIIPMGPFLQYATEKPADPIELRIYRGADGGFTLYEDENDNYNYEKGIYSTITFTWDDSNRELTIAARKGEFPGLLTTRTFNVVLVSKGHGMGLEITKNFDTVIAYSGKKVTIKL